MERFVSKNYGKYFGGFSPVAGIKVVESQERLFSLFRITFRFSPVAGIKVVESTAGFIQDK